MIWKIQSKNSMSVYLPKEVVYSDDTLAILSEGFVLKEGNLRLYVPKNKIDDVVDTLKNSGFKEVRLQFYKGEKYSLSKMINNTWELHIRIYPDGFIDSHIEICRDYFEHLDYQAIPTIFEVFNFYKSAYNKLLIFDNVTKKWIKEVRNYYVVTLKCPRSLTPWKPIVTMAVILLGIMGISYALSKS